MNSRIVNFNYCRQSDYYNQTTIIYDKSLVGYGLESDNC